MAEFIEVMKQKNRMCESNSRRCSKCFLAAKNNGKELHCNDLCLSYPQEAEKIIMDWAKEHPIMTNAEKFKEVFGFKMPKFQIDACFGFECPQEDCKGCEHYNFWKTEYVEPKKENEDGKID